MSYGKEGEIMPRGGWSPAHRAKDTIMLAAKLLGLEPDQLTEEEAIKVLQDNVMRNEDIRIRKAVEDVRNPGT